MFVINSILALFGAAVGTVLVLLPAVGLLLHTAATIGAVTR